MLASYLTTLNVLTLVTDKKGIPKVCKRENKIKIANTFFFFPMDFLSGKVPPEIPDFLSSLVREHQIVIGYRKTNLVSSL